MKQVKMFDKNAKLDESLEVSEVELSEVSSVSGSGLFTENEELDFSEVDEEKGSIDYWDRVVTI